MATPFPPLPLLRVQAYERFRDQILQGHIRPGQVLSQRALTQLLAVPLAAVRELVPRLEAEGLLRTIPQRGLQIAHVDLKLIHNAYHLRRLLEVEAASRFVATVTDADLALVEDAHRRIVERACHGTVDAALLADASAVDSGFHELMIDSLGNELIAEIYRVNSLRIRLIKLEGAVMSGEVLQSTMREHLKVVEAIKRRDPHEVRRCIEAHVDSALARVLALP